MKLRPSLKKQPGYKVHFLNAECYRIAACLRPQKTRVFIAVEDNFANPSCQRTFFGASFRENEAFSIDPMHPLLYTTGNITIP